MQIEYSVLNLINVSDFCGNSSQESQNGTPGASVKLKKLLVCSFWFVRSTNQCIVYICMVQDKTRHVNIRVQKVFEVPAKFPGMNFPNRNEQCRKVRFDY